MCWEIADSGFFKLCEDEKTFMVRCLSLGHVSGYCGFLPAANADLTVCLVVSLPCGSGLGRFGRSYYDN